MLLFVHFYNQVHLLLSVVFAFLQPGHRIHLTLIMVELSLLVCVCASMCVTCIRFDLSTHRFSTGRECICGASTQA